MGQGGHENFMTGMWEHTQDERIFGEGAVKSFPGHRCYTSRKVEFAKDSAPVVGSLF